MEISKEELNNLILDASREGAKEAIREARRQKTYRDGMDTYQKTEYILKNYTEFKKAIDERNEQIADISRNGIKKKSCSITSYPGSTRTVADDLDKAEEQINMLKHQNDITKRLIDKIDNVLSELKNEPYFVILEMYYIDKKKYEVIAGELGISIASVSSVKKNMLEKIKIRIFADEVIREIMGA